MEIWFRHGCCGDRRLEEHERNHGLGMVAVVTVCKSTGLSAISSSFNGSSLNSDMDSGFLCLKQDYGEGQKILACVGLRAHATSHC